MLDGVEINYEGGYLLDKLKPCPFCGEKVSLGISDDEGNKRDEEYEREPWSGLSFTLIHEYKNDIECPIATHEDMIVGSLLYNDKEEAIRVWNSRRFQ